MIIIDLDFALESWDRSIDRSLLLLLSLSLAAADICVLHFSILFFDLFLRPTQKKTNQVLASIPTRGPLPQTNKQKETK
jgi:hypothetical protein